MKTSLTFLEMFFSGLDEFESSQLESTLLKSLDDLSDQIALNAIGLVDDD